MIDQQHPPKHGAHGRLFPAALLILAMCTLMAAWVMSSVPFQAPDEGSHYLRALGIASGQLLGAQAPYNIALTPAQMAWVDQSMREVRVPAAMRPPSVNCRDGVPDVTPDGCEEVTEVGNYQPLPYLLPALGLKLSSNAASGLWTARFLSALPCAAFFAFAILCLWNGTLMSILGLALALSPMVFFVSSVINPNGFEIAASTALLAGLLRLARGARAADRRVWLLVAVAAAGTVLAWQLGPVFLVIDVVVALLAGGPSWARTLGVERPRAAIGFVVVVIAALLAYAIYDHAAGSTHLQVTVDSVGPSLKLGVHQLIGVLKYSVGNFGALTVHLPRMVIWADWAAVVALCLAAFLTVGWTGKAKLAIVSIGALAFPVLFYAFIYRASGFGMQGRYMLPVEMIIPLYAGETLSQGKVGQPPRAAFQIFVRVGFVFAGALAIVAWWINARSVSFAKGVLPGVGWSPPLGWWPWIVLAVLGAAGIVVCVLTRDFENGTDRHPRPWFPAPRARQIPAPTRATYRPE